MGRHATPEVIKHKTKKIGYSFLWEKNKRKIVLLTKHD